MIVVGVLMALSGADSASPPPALTPLEQQIVASLNAKQTELNAINHDIWTWSELGLQEHRSSARLSGALESAGFRVKRGISGMPTAFVAEYGSGRPIIGLLAEYDALPDLSQQIAGERQPAPDRTTGHGCGHSALGTAIIGAGLAIREAYDQHRLQGTIRIYGTPAEETVIGKVYMTLDSQFDDLDACLHWHPSTRNQVSHQSSKALVSAKFTFNGLPAHASASPQHGRSALDAVELMNVGVNYMREHVKETNRVHYVITQGGGQPNVVPAKAQVWYFVRGATHGDVEHQFEWVKEVADAAAKMTRTTVEMAIDTDCHEMIPNLPIAKVIDRNYRKIGPPAFNDEERALAKQICEPLLKNLREQGNQEPMYIHDKLEEFRDELIPPMTGSTDVGDVSWRTPTSGLAATCFVAEAPGHSWQNVATTGSAIGQRGLLTAAKVLALSAVDLLQDQSTLKEAKAELVKQLNGRQYRSLVPAGQPAPKAIR